VLKSIEEGISNASVKQRLDELEASKTEIEVSLAREKIEKTPISKEQIVFWISRFKGGDINDPDYRKAIADIFINSVFLYDDKIVLTFNWKDGTKTVTLSELESTETAISSGFRGSHLDYCAPKQINYHQMIQGIVSLDGF
jgi:hypothetical protein